MTSNGWKVSEEYPSSKWQPDYLKEMVAETLADGMRPPKPVVPTTFNGKLVADLSPAERKDFIFSMQPKSTQEALTRQKDRDPKDDLEFLLRPISEDYLAVKDAKSLDELVPARAMTPEEYSHAQSVRSRQKNTRGESKESSLIPEKRERAIEAFTYSKPANPSVADLKRLHSLDAIDAIIASAEAKPAQPKKPSWWQRVKMRFWGNPYTWNAEEERKRLGIE